VKLYPFKVWPRSARSQSAGRQAHSTTHVLLNLNAREIPIGHVWRFQVTWTFWSATWLRLYRETVTFFVEMRSRLKRAALDKTK
jgi:uncharacterized ferritin-like protein (DUF455 family)